MSATDHLAPPSTGPLDFSNVLFGFLLFPSAEASKILVQARDAGRQGLEVLFHCSNDEICCLTSSVTELVNREETGSGPRTKFECSRLKPIVVCYNLTSIVTINAVISIVPLHGLLLSIKSWACNTVLSKLILCQGCWNKWTGVKVISSAVKVLL